ncbi:MAG: YIEGIA family protein [Bacillota bacterium]
MDRIALSILVGMGLGFVARLAMLRVDYRQYPSYPHGYVNHLALGFIAAALGAVALPALVKNEFTAVTFLALAAQQFREVRGMERQALGKLDEISLIPRGQDYIEGIARTFEARNYLVIFVALATSAITYLFQWPQALAVGALLIYIFARYLMKGQEIGDIADVVPAKVHFQGALLYVEDIVMMNVGLKAVREKILQDGLGVLLKPKDDDARATIDEIGQRQAILHTAAALLGSKKDLGEPEWGALARKNIDTGVIGIFIVPNEKDIEVLLEAVRRVPVLETSRRKPLATRAGRAAAD